jgi:copper resistance protein B
MHIKCLSTLILFSLSHSGLALASDEHKHGNEIYHSVTIEAGAGSNHKGDSFAEWDVEAWLGTDENKLWLKAEGEREQSTTESAETWLMYSRNIATFWDAQIGIRHDNKPDTLDYAVVGIHGLARYFFETDAHLFVSEDGDVSARISQANEFLITQRWILEPYFEADFFAQDVAELEVGSGLSSAELGIQTRYELTRDFAPYFDIKYERKFAETASIARQHNENVDTFIAQIGVKLLF